MIEEMFGGCTQLRNVMGPESGLDTKTSPAKTTRSPPGKGSGKRDHRGVPENDHPDAHFPLTRPTSLEMCYSAMRLDPKPGNGCFGCGGANPRGMKLAFEQDDTRQRIVGRFQLGEEYQ